jgi:uncharacterized RDD family membrane protein YckC
MALAQIQVVSSDSGRPGIWRSLVRSILIALFNAPLLLSPLAVGLAISLKSIGSPYILAVMAPLIAASAAACLSPAFSRDRIAWHDRLAGTRVLAIED